ncbi:alkene reductase [Lysobacter sp. TY2-98]|uniref:alkene reductase n=1 Tax=Lysobacter sp. TY2-98 TaxID=2290922 RepID=UPI000E201A92|nr:alkene reductase [Lysobacter sp. TY2-98]AXK72104.1 alkene reductase [Lysobacter sp. TY2-98]
MSSSAASPAPVATQAPSLFDPVRIGAIDMANRIVMAPLTRSRAEAGLVPSPLAVDYYGQRASAGLIITEATQVSWLAQGYISTPGLFTTEQIEGWKKVTDEVHRRGGRIVVQLWHVGRISHTSLLPPGEVPVAPSAIRADTKTFTPEGFVDVSEPRALGIEEIPGIVEDFRKAARNAIDAGFDGVEVHAANGYLIDQFLRDKTNHRSDAYGGSIENRTRFLHEVVQAVVQEIGADRTGVRIAPVTPSNDIADSNPQPLFERAVERLDALNIAYVHVVEGATGGPRDVQPFDYEALRSRFRGAWIVNNGYDLEMAQAAVREGRADAVAFGRLFISNPDLVRRLREGAPLVEPDRDTFYSGGAKGYVDYPALADTD